MGGQAEMSSAHATTTRTVLAQPETGGNGRDLNDKPEGPPPIPLEVRNVGGIGKGFAADSTPYASPLNQGGAAHC